MAEPSASPPPAVDLTPQCWSHVFSQLPAREVARVACVSQHWHELVAHDEHLWRRQLAQDLGITTKRGADGVERRTFREAYVSWRHSYGTAYWPFLGRAIAAWDAIKAWLGASFPALLATLRPGASEADVAEAEAALGFALPPAVKVIYRLHDGQALAFDAAWDRRAAAAEAGGAAAAAAAADAAGPETPAELASIFHGLLGGYSVYSHLVVTRLMPLARAVRWTRQAQLSRLRPQLMCFACSFRVHDKMFVVDGADGRLWVMRRSSQRRTSLQPAVPAGGAAEPAARDGVLRWFEEYARRLAGGWYGVEPLDEDYPEGSRGISLFPLHLQGGLAEAVTRGVRVRASVVYAPEEVPNGKHLFAYRLRFALLPPNEQWQQQQQQQHRAAAPAGPVGEGAAAALGGGGGVAGGGAVMSRCQLVSRHWVIRDEAGNVADEVRGEGVIGKYPLLVAGDPAEFAYASCTHQAAARGSMEGEFSFVEGSIESQLGPAFDVACPPFRLDVPAFIY